ncbi:MAG: transcription elongation factor GreA [Clostridiales bacterium]|mgnify:CR=1 FL=1|nr:transcription elongation factor GreA [Clostridiales bacterium]
MPKYRMSEKRLNELKDELSYLQTVREKEVSELIKEARSFGDLSENSEYDEAKTEQGKLYSKIAEIKNLIENAEIVEHSQEQGKVVLGATVVLLNLDDNTEECYRIVGSQEANPLNGLISEEAPLGGSLIGLREGDEIHLEPPKVPAGKLNYRIISIKTTH